MGWNKTTFAACGLAGLVAACGTDDDTATRFRVDIENLTVAGSHSAAVAQAVPVGATEPGPLLPGDAYEVSFHAAPGASLSFAAMMVQSNDWFYAPRPGGIALFEDGQPISGDITGEIRLWDAGTEADETPGEGPNQAPRQSGANTGPDDPDATVREVSTIGLPDVDDVIAATLVAGEGNQFTLRIENISTAETLPTSGDPVAVPVAPVALVVHGDGEPLFSIGGAASAGLEMLAEDGSPAGLVGELEALTQIATPLAPGAWVVHAAAAPIFDGGSAASAGLEALAEDGTPSALVAELDAAGFIAAAFDTPAGASSPGPALPGATYSFEIEASAGDSLSFATMFVQSNDWFVGPGPVGIALFDAGGAPISGDVTAQVSLWDAGTELDEAPGAGPNQAPRQSGPDVGGDEGGEVRAISPAAPVLPVAETVRVTITPL